MNANIGHASDSFAVYGKIFAQDSGVLAELYCMKVCLSPNWTNAEDAKVSISTQTNLVQILDYSALHLLLF